MPLKELRSSIVPHTCATAVELAGAGSGYPPAAGTGGRIQINDPVGERNWNAVRRNFADINDNFNLIGPLLNILTRIENGGVTINNIGTSLLPVILQQHVRNAAAGPAGPINAAQFNLTTGAAGPAELVYNRERIFDDRVSGCRGWAVQTGDKLELLYLEPVHYSSQFDIESSEPTLSVLAGTTVPFDLADVACTNNAALVYTGTPGHFKSLGTAELRVTAKVLGKRTVADANFNVWCIWLQKSVDAGVTWTHIADSMDTGLAYYSDAGAGLSVGEKFDIGKNNQVRVRAMQINGSNGDVQIISQYQPTIDSATLHFGSKLLLEYLDQPTF